MWVKYCKDDEPKPYLVNMEWNFEKLWFFYSKFNNKIEVKTYSNKTKFNLIETCYIDDDAMTMRWKLLPIVVWQKSWLYLQKKKKQ